MEDRSVGAMGLVLVLVGKLVPGHRGQGEAKEADTLDWQVACLVSEGTPLGGLFWVAASQVDPYTSH